MKHRPILAKFVALIALGSGVVCLVSLVNPSFPDRSPWLADVFPFEIRHVSRFLILLIGFGLIISSINLYRRKRRAFLTVVLLSALSILFHLTKGHDYSAALVSAALLLFLLLERRSFTVKSGPPDFRSGLLRLPLAFLIGLAYGVAGFWFLDLRAFGIDFSIGESIRQTLHFFFLGGGAQMVPRTHHANWFVDSLYLMSATVILYSLISLFRPALYIFRTLPRERARGQDLLVRYGRSALDYFKTWPDKSLYFARDGGCFLAYRVGANFAVVLGDPVGPEEAIEGCVQEFVEFCQESDWDVAFHQTLPDFLPTYRRLGFRKLKVGDDAIVDLTRFTLEGKQGKNFRYVVNHMEKIGVRAESLEPPLADEIVRQVKEVSDEWLRIPGRRERRFTLGLFDPDYVRSTPLLVARDAGGRMLAFLNLIPSYAPGEATIDLMRRRADSPDGIMDYLFIEMFRRRREAGFQRFNLGMAPMSGFQEREEASAEERAIHYFFQHLSFIMSYRGLRAYKAKFATSWEPRYTVYRSVLDLPRLAVALAQITEIRE